MAWYRTERGRDARAGGSVQGQRPFVVPVLVDQATMPTKAQLSPALHRFVELQYNEIRSGYFDIDVNVVARVLRET